MEYPCCTHCEEVGGTAYCARGHKHPCFTDCSGSTPTTNGQEA